MSARRTQGLNALMLATGSCHACSHGPAARFAAARASAALVSLAPAASAVAAIFECVGLPGGDSGRNRGVVWRACLRLSAALGPLAVSDTKPTATNAAEREVRRDTGEREDNAHAR